MTKVAIIGGGIGGLSAAIMLASEGIEVAIYERQKHVGGNILPVRIGQHQFDFGPSYFTMPEVLQSLFKIAGKKSEDYLQINHLRKHTKISFEDGSYFYVSNDVEFMKEQLAELDPFGCENYDRFMEEIERLYLDVSQIYSAFQITSWTKLVSMPIRNVLLKLRPFENLDQFLRKYFSNEHIIQALSRYANEGNISSKTKPAFLAGYLYPNLSKGVYSVKGGNQQIPLALAKVATELGVRIYTEKKITQIHVKDGHIEGVQINDDISLEADAILMSQLILKDFPNLLAGDSAEKPKNKWFDERINTPASYTFLVGLNYATSLNHHSLLFSNDIEEEIEAMSNNHLAIDPTIYIFNAAATEPERFPYGDSLIIMANAPYSEEDNVSYRAELASLKQIIVEKLKRFGHDIQPHIIEEQIWTPLQLSEQFNIYRGTIHGIIAASFSQAFFRPPIRCEEISGLYFTMANTSHTMGTTEAIQNGIQLASLIIDDLNNNKNANQAD
ncbi:phytoene desaturase family protein [Kurthia sibirica]|uniref:Amine oxidase domain-containing protein n=1 Tax=Kurthia sibirica TaxID=202750 RepID=A0A2U3ALX5_9BACL|nr:FAD-dependent oxidoreductase [Kurthia sibirica]PWI25522.1 hypothetical protein DEX24_07905 [Kurthia sibirica]GEK33898.1 diapolycopene oxygenase [Kurthia sibirica]